MNHLTEEELIALYYRESEAASAVSGHLESCEECRLNYDRLRRFLNGVEAPPIPERDPLFEERMWQRVRSHLESKSRFDWKSLFQPRRLAAVGTGAALIVIAFLAGRFWRRPPAPGIEQPISQAARERIMLMAVADHLDRSQRVLLEVMNSQDTPTVDISAEQRRAEDLVESNRLYRQAALKAGDAGVANVLDELERVLLEIARGPSTLSASDLESLRQRIDEHGLLFKIQVMDNQVQQREQEMTRQAMKNQT